MQKMRKPGETNLEIVVSYLGPSASFSHQAAINAFQLLPDADLVPAPTFADVFNAVQAPRTKDGEYNSVRYGVVPFENSSNGSVVQLLELLADHDGRYADVTVCGEYYLAVHHCLMARKMPGIDGSISPPKLNVAQGPDPGRLKGISQLYTHPQVWGQCTKFLTKHMTGVERIDVGSTSLAAQKIKQEQHDGRVAAIASKLAAEVNGLDVLAEDIEDHGDNTTRFFVVRNVKAGESHLEQIQEEEGFERDRESKWKSLISFMIDHESPGSLADALAVFKDFDFNLTSIYTRPSRQLPWHYIFFVECEETRTAHNTQNQEKMMDELKRHTQRFRHLGCWRDQLSDPNGLKGMDSRHMKSD